MPLIACPTLHNDGNSKIFGVNLFKPYQLHTFDAQKKRMMIGSSKPTNRRTVLMNRDEAGVVVSIQHRSVYQNATNGLEKINLYEAFAA